MAIGGILGWVAGRRMSGRWCTPFIAVGICLRKRLGRACLIAIAVALLLTAIFDGGHLVRRAYEGKF